MTQTPARPDCLLTARPLRWGIVFLGCASIVLSGCGVRKRPGIPWAAAVQVRPVLQVQTAQTSGVSEDAIPDLQLEWPPFPIPLIAVRSAPPRPHVSGASPASSAGGAEKSEAPMISPQLTPQESAADQRETNQSLGIAEKNLASTRGKKLNAAQSDLASKVKGFLKDAREAAQIGDWSHARSLAKKAQVLSEELASSL
jgi:hypothetical protein